MFLSMLELNPRNRQVQSELRDPYQMHRTLSKAFGDGEGEYKEARCLFRVDELDSGNRLLVLVQSKVRPNWETWTPADGYLAGELQIKEFNPAVTLGQRLGFRLRANPTVKRDGKRLGIEKEEEQMQWLARKSTKGGFRLLSAYVKSDGKIESQNVLGKDGKLISAVFNGVLEVTDVEEFKNTLSNGIGSAKGFGFGLLSVAPAR